MAMLPIVTINGRDYYADLRLKECRAVNNPHVRIGYVEILGNPDKYVFTEPIQRGKVIVYNRRSDGLLSVAVADLSGCKKFQDYPWDVRVHVRVAFACNRTSEEMDRLVAADALPKPYRELVVDDILCARADAVMSHIRKEQDMVRDIQQVARDRPDSPVEKAIKQTVETVVKVVKRKTMRM
jgi:hypothetical protein